MRTAAGALALVLLLSGAASAGGYADSVREWRAAYEKSLRADDGWLTLAGLFWLKPGENTAGASARCDIVLPANSAPPRIGVFDFHDGRITFRAATGAAVTVNGKRIPAATLKPDSSGSPDLVQAGSLTLFVIHRKKGYAIRVKDRRSPALRNFSGTRWYSVDAQFRVVADFHAYSSPKSIPIPDILGETNETPSPGYTDFVLRGAKLHLEPVVDEGELFFIFRDRTSGKTTYGAGRFLKAALPTDGKVVLDFNEAYNPPCAFTPYATCPLPPAANRLAAAIEAGELQYGDR